MANGRFRYYYWRITTLITENSDIVRLDQCSSEDEADYAGRLDFRLVFNDNSQLIVIGSLRSNDDVIEYDYYYGYKDSNGVRIFAYDDRDHHPDISTSPHHLHIGSESENNPPLPCDLNRVSFFTVFQKICNEFFT